jgi:hypothetical protein
VRSPFGIAYRGGIVAEEEEEKEEGENFPIKFGSLKLAGV